MLQVLVSFLLFAGAAMPARKVSVCELLADPQKFSGETVTFQAVLVASYSSEFDEYTIDELEPAKSERCYSAAIRDNLRMGISGDAHSSLPESYKESYKPDLNSLDRALEIVNAIFEKDPALRRILVSVEGIVYSGGPRPSDVTNDPWHPVIILITKFKDVRKP